MLEKKWKTLDGLPVDIVSALADELSTRVDCELHVGTDSQQMGTKTEFVTVAVVVRPRKGARVFYYREKVPRIKSLRERLTREAWLSMELAMELTSTPDIGKPMVEMEQLTIHIDANPDPRFKSSAYVQELAGMCVGQGFNVLLKPHAWAAMHAADHAVKHKTDKYEGQRKTS